MKMNMMELSRFVKWSVFGDGYVGYSTNHRNAHYAVSRAPTHTDYILYVKSRVECLQDCNVKLSHYTRRDNGKEVVSLVTSPHPLFSRIRARQYIKGHRVLDEHMLTLCDWVSIAMLYMDDGSLTYNKQGAPIVRISSCAYSYFEHCQLKRFFAERFNLCFNIHKTKSKREILFQLFLCKKSHDVFFDGIKDHILDSYNYKLPASLQKEAPNTSVKGDDLV